MLNPLETCDHYQYGRLLMISCCHSVIMSQVRRVEQKKSDIHGQFVKYQQV